MRAKIVVVGRGNEHRALGLARRREKTTAVFDGHHPVALAMDDEQWRADLGDARQVVETILDQ